MIKNYFVEIDIPYIIKISNIRNEKYNYCSIKYENDKIKISGLLEDYDDDGFATLRLDKNLICFETEFDIKTKRMIKKYIEIEVDKLNLYDEKII